MAKTLFAALHQEKRELVKRLKMTSPTLTNLRSAIQSRLARVNTQLREAQYAKDSGFNQYQGQAITNA